MKTKVNSISCGMIVYDNVKANAKKLIQEVMSSYHSERDLDFPPLSSIVTKMNEIVKEQFNDKSKEEELILNSNGLYLGAYMALNSLAPILVNNRQALNKFLSTTLTDKQFETKVEELNEFISFTEDFNKQRADSINLDSFLDKLNGTDNEVFDNILPGIDSILKKPTLNTLEGVLEGDVDIIDTQGHIYKVSSQNQTEQLPSMTNGTKQGKLKLSDVEDLDSDEDASYSTEANDFVDNAEELEFKKSLKFKGSLFPAEIKDEDRKEFIYKLLTLDSSLIDVTEMTDNKLVVAVKITTKNVNNEFIERIIEFTVDNYNSINPTYSFKQLEGESTLLKGIKTYFELANKLGHGDNGAKGQFGKGIEIIDQEDLAAEEEVVRVNRTERREREGIAISYSNTLPKELSSANIFSSTNIKSRLLRAYLSFKNSFFGNLTNNKNEVELSNNLLRNNISSLFMSNKELQNKYKTYSYKLKIKKDDLSYAEDLDFPQERLALYLEITDRNNNPVNIFKDLYNISDTDPNSSVNKDIKLSNLKVPTEQSQQEYINEYSKLVEAVNNRGEINATGLKIPNNSDLDMLSVYQPPQQYNKNTDEIKPYRLHINEQYRLGNYNEELSFEELSSVANNMTIMKSLGYNIHSDLDSIVGINLDAYNRNNNTLLEEVLTTNSINNTNPNSIVTINRILNDVKNNKQLSNNDSQTLEQFKIKLKAPLKLPQKYHTLLLQSLGFNVNEYIIKQGSDNGKGNYSGNSSVLISPSTAISDKTKEFDNQPGKQSSKHKGSIQINQRAPLTFTEFSKEDLSTNEAKKSMLSTHQSVYFYNQTLEYIEALENYINKNSNNSYDLEQVSFEQDGETITGIIIKDNLRKGKEIRIRANGADYDIPSDTPLTKTGNKFKRVKSGKSIYFLGDNNVVYRNSNGKIETNPKLLNTLNKENKEEESTEIQRVKRIVANAKVSLFNLGNPYGFGYNTKGYLENEYPNTGLPLEQEVTNDDGSVTIQELGDRSKYRQSIAADYYKTLDTLSEIGNSLGLKGKNLRQRVEENNSGRDLNYRERVNELSKKEETIEVEINYENINTIKEVKRTSVTIDMQGPYKGTSYSNYVDNKTIDILVVEESTKENDYIEGEYGGHYLVELDAFDIKTKFKAKNLVNVTIDGETKTYVRTRKGFSDNSLFSAWYSADGLNRYVGLRLKDGGITVLTSNNTLEAIEHANTKHNEFKSSSRQEQLNTINENSTRLFGSFTDLVEEGDRITGKINESKKEAKINSVVINNSPNKAFAVGNNNFADIDTDLNDPSKLSIKVSHGGIRSNEIMELYNRDNYTNEMLEVLDNTQTSTTVLFNPIRQKSSTKLNGPQPPLTKTSKLSSKYTVNDIYPMFPHMVIDLKNNEDVLYNTNVETKQQTNTTNTTNSTTTSTEKSEELKQTEANLRAKFEQSKNNEDSKVEVNINKKASLKRERRGRRKIGRIDFTSLGQVEEISYDISQEELIDLYENTIGITPTVLTKAEYDALEVKDDKFYIVKSGSKFILPNTKEEAARYLGYAGMNINALHTKGDKFSKVVAKHEILHSILNQFMPRARKERILESVKQLILKDTTRKESTIDEVNKLTDTELEEYLVLLKEGTDLGNNWKSIKNNRIVKSIEKSFIGKFISRILGRKNPITDFLSWIVSSYKKTINFRNQLELLNIDLSYNNFRRTSNLYNNYINLNEESDINQPNYAQFIGRLDSQVEEKSTQAKRLHKAFSNPFEDNENTAVLEGSVRYDLVEKDVSEKVVSFQFAAEVYDLFKERINIGEVVGKLETSYLESEIDALYDLELGDRADELLDKLEDHLANEVRLKYSEIQLIASELQDIIKDKGIEAFEDNATNLANSYYGLSTISNTRTILNYMFEELEFDSIEDGASFEDGSIDNGQDFITKDATYLSTFDTLSKKVKNHVYNTSYTIKDENGNTKKLFIDSKNAQSFLVKLFQMAQQTNVKGENNHIFALQEAWKKFLADKGDNNPNSTAYYEARAVYDKIFKINETFIPVAPNSNYVSNYNYSYSEVAFNSESLTLGNDNVIGLINNETIANSNILEEAIKNNDIETINLISANVLGDENNAGNLTKYLEHFTKLNLEREYMEILDKYNNSSNEVKIDPITSQPIPYNPVTALQTLLNDIKEISINYNDINPAIVQLHQDAFNSITSMFYSNWRVNFSKASLTKNYVKNHVDVGEKQTRGRILSSQTGMLNTVYNTTYTALNDNIIQEFIEVELGENKKRVINTNRNENSRYGLTHDKNSIVIKLPFNKANVEGTFTINLKRSDIDTTGSFAEIKSIALDKIAKQMSNVEIEGVNVDVTSDIASAFYNKIGLSMSKPGIRSFQNSFGVEGVKDMVEHMIHAYAFMQKTHEDSQKIPPAESTLLTSLVRLKNTVNPYDIVDKSKTQTKNTTDEVKDGESLSNSELKIYSVTRDIYDKVIGNLEESNALHKQSSEKNAFYAGSKRYAFDKYTTPLFEHLEALTRIEMDNMYKEIIAYKNDLNNDPDADFSEENERIIKLKRQFKFMSSPLFRNKLVEASINLSNEGEGTVNKTLSSEGFSIFNYIENTSSGNGKGFLNLNIKELQRQVLNDFFLYPGKSGNKYGTYHSNRYNEYKQPLEAQANRGMLPIVELNSKVFYDYEGKDNEMLNLPISEYGLGIKAESELFNVYSNASSYLFNVTNELNSLSKYDSNIDLGLFIDNTYLNQLIQTTDRLTLAGNTDIATPLLIFNTFKSNLNSYELNSKDNNKGFKDIITRKLTNSFELLVDQQNELISKGLPVDDVLVTKLGNKIQYLNNILTTNVGTLEINKRANELAEVYKETYLNRFKESFVMLNEYYVNKAGVDSESIAESKEIIESLREDYNTIISDMSDLNFNLESLLESEAHLRINETLTMVNNSLINGYTNNTEEKTFTSHNPLPSPKLQGMLNNEIMDITNNYNNQLYELKKDKPKFNKLSGQLTPNRHFDKGNNVTVINGIVGFDTESAIQLYEKSLNETVSFNQEAEINLEAEKESIRNDIRSKLALLKVLKGLGISRQNLNDIVNKKIDVHEEYLQNKLNDLNITTDGSYTELLQETLDGLDTILESKGINSVEETKIPTIGKYLYTNASESFDSYISTLKTEMVRFGLQSIEQEVEFTGLTKTMYDESGRFTAPIKQKESNDRYNTMLLNHADTYLEDLGEGLEPIENPNKLPININVNGVTLKDFEGKKFMYTEQNSNSDRRTNDEPTLNAGSYVFFSKDAELYDGTRLLTAEERLDLFKQADIDTQLDNINPIILDFFLTNKVNGTYLSQYIDGDIYRYKGSDVTAKVIDEIKRIGTNSTPGTKPIFRETVELSNQVAIIEGKELNKETNKFEDKVVGYNTVTDTVIVNNNGLSINHNIANVPDEVYDVMQEEYKYFRDVSASTHESDYLALSHIKRNLLHYGTLSKSEVNKLSVSNLVDLKKTDSSSKDNKGLYIRKNAKYTINSKGNIELTKDNEGTIIGKSGEDIQGFEAWDGATFMSNLMGMLIINSYGNKEGIDMTQQGLKMINNNLDAKTQNGISMKSLQVKFTAKFAFDASPQVKAMIKEGYRTGILDTDFNKRHTYKKGTTYEKVTINPETQEEVIEELVLPYDLTMDVTSGEWDINGNFIAPKLKIDENNDFIQDIRYKNLYDVYWENGGWNPNENGEFETVYFDGTTKPATKETNATTKISKSDFEVFKAYIESRETARFMVKDKKTNELLDITTYREEFNIDDNLTDDQVILKIQASDDFVYMDSVMLFNPGSGTKKGARTSNPNFVGYKGEFDNIVSQPMENFSYIITINKKDKPGQDVALSSQFTYLLGMEDNVFEAQSIYDAIAELSKEKRSEFDSKIEKTRKDLVKRGAIGSIKETLQKMSGASDLVDNLSPKVISVLIQHRLVNSKASSLDMDKLTKDNMVDIFNEVSDTSSLTETEIDVLAEAILEMTAVKRYMMDIVKSNAEASSDFNQVWEHVANQNNVDEMAISNPVLFNKLFNDVAARVSKGMSLRVNGKKAVQMPISQMKKLMIYNNKAYVRTDLFKLFKKENPSKTNQEVFKMIEDKIVDKEIIERSVRYGNPDQELDKITHTEVEAANPMMLKYSFLKDLSMRDIFDIDVNNKTLSLEANTFEEIDNVVENIKEVFTKLEETKDSIKVNGKDVTFNNILKADTSEITTLANSAFGTMLLEDAKNTLNEYDKIEALTKYERDTLINNEEAIQEAKEIYENRLTKRIQRLEQELNSIEVEDRQKKVSKLQNALSERESINSMNNEQLAKYIKTSVNYDVSQHNEAKNSLMFIEAIREGKNFNEINEELRNIVGSGSKKLLEKLYKEYYNDFTNSVKYTNRSLYGIMSRVPNTGLNSNSFFKIATFNNEYGNSVFIPAEWLDISGSDHDGDTLQLWQLDPYGKNKSSDKALEKASKIMTKYDNTSVIFSKLDLSLKPIQDAASAKYSKPGMYLKPNDAWSLFNIISQNAVGSTVVGTAALLGKNYTYSNQVVKTLVEFLNTQMDARNLENIDNSIVLENEVDVVIETSVEELQDIYDMLGDASSIIEFLTEENYTKDDIASSLNVVDISVELKGDILELLCL